MAESEDKEGEGGTSDETLRGITLFPALSKLINPTAELLGTELRDALKSKIDELKEKRRAKNLVENLRIAQTEMPEGGFDSGGVESVEQLELFDEWCDGAQDASPESELAQIWRNLLSRIAAGEDRAERMLKALRAMSPSEVRLMLQMVENGRSLPNADREADLARLRVLGLASRGNPLVFIRWCLLVALLAASALIFQIWGQLSSSLRDSVGGYLVAFLFSPTGLVLLVPILIGFFFGSTHFPFRHYPTALAHALVQGRKT